MRFPSLLAAAVLSFCPAAVAQTDQPAAGIPLEIADQRAATISDLRYGLTLTIPKLAGEPIAGEATLRFVLKEASAPLVLDFATSAAHVRSLSANGNAAFTWTNGHIVVPRGSLRAGENSLAISFTAGDASLNRSADFLYALFVPARANLAIPCFDQPSLKARWTLALRVPRDATWQVVGNGELQSRAEVEAAGDAGAAKLTEYRFAETKPLPT